MTSRLTFLYIWATLPALHLPALAMLSDEKQVCCNILFYTKTFYILFLLRITSRPIKWIMELGEVEKVTISSATQCRLHTFNVLRFHPGPSPYSSRRERACWCCCEADGPGFPARLTCHVWSFFRLTWPGTLTCWKKVQGSLEQCHKTGSSRRVQEENGTVQNRSASVWLWNPNHGYIIPVQIKDKRGNLKWPTSRCSNFELWKFEKEIRLSTLIQWHQSRRWGIWPNDNDSRNQMVALARASVLWYMIGFYQQFGNLQVHLSYEYKPQIIDAQSGEDREYRVWKASSRRLSASKSPTPHLRLKNGSRSLLQNAQIALLTLFKVIKNPHKYVRIQKCVNVSFITACTA